MDYHEGESDTEYFIAEVVATACIDRRVTRGVETMSNESKITKLDKITIDNRFRPELLVSDDDARGSLTLPYLRRDPDDGSKWVIDVTNGHYAARFPVIGDEGGGLIEGWLNPRLWAIERKEQKKLTDHTLTAEISTDRGAFPSFAEIMPRDEPQKQAYTAFNPAYLALIAKAFGLEKGSGLKLEFFGELDPIRVTPICRSFPKSLWALLMPMRSL